MKYRGIFEYEYPTEHKPPVSIDVHLHGDCVKGKIIEWEYRPLEQEPTAKNDLGVDCISRQAVIEITAETGALETQDRVKALPSVTPIRPKGHWIPVRVDRYSEQYGHFKINEYKCSNCNSEFEYGYHNYCPYCGAKMVEPQESEDI